MQKGKKRLPLLGIMGDSRCVGEAISTLAEDDANKSQETEKDKEKI